MRPRVSCFGFTLVELAIVLVVIALLAGGILVGQNLIRNAETQSVIRDVGRYREAVGNFNAKYRALPGDMSDATGYWGTDPGGCPPGANTVPKKTTCNGNGDGWIGAGFLGTQQYERFRAWQHLSNAGMVDGMYPGVAGPADLAEALIGINTPKTDIEGAGVCFRAIGNTESGHPSYYDGFYGNFFDVGGKTTQSCYGPAFSPHVASEIDLKIDDGRPAFGSVMAFKKNSPITPDCTTSDTASVAKYDLASETELCSVMVFLGL